MRVEVFAHNFYYEYNVIRVRFVYLYVCLLWVVKHEYLEQKTEYLELLYFPYCLFE